MSDLDRLFENNIRPLLDLIDSLRDYLESPDIPIPTIITMGMQSSGKSSTLESITHIKLPQGEDMVTITPIEIQLRNLKEDKDDYAIVKFADDINNKDVINCDLEEVGNVINQFQDKLRQEHGLKPREKKLFNQKILVKVFRKNAVDLTLVDLPGLNFNENIESASIAICEDYIKRPENTVLVILSAMDDVSNSFGTKLLRKYNDAKLRFIPIITKSDILKTKNFKIYMDSIKELGLSHKPSFIVNKFKDYENEVNSHKINNKIYNVNENDLGQTTLGFSAYLKDLSSAPGPIANF